MKFYIAVHIFNCMTRCKMDILAEVSKDDVTIQMIDYIQDEKKR